MAWKLVKECRFLFCFFFWMKLLSVSLPTTFSFTPMSLELHAFQFLPATFCCSWQSDSLTFTFLPLLLLPQAYMLSAPHLLQPRTHYFQTTSSHERAATSKKKKATTKVQVIVLLLLDDLSTPLPHLVIIILLLLLVLLLFYVSIFIDSLVDWILLELNVKALVSLNWLHKLARTSATRLPAMLSLNLSRRGQWSVTVGQKFSSNLSEKSPGWSLWASARYFTCTCSKWWKEVSPVQAFVPDVLYHTLFLQLPLVSSHTCLIHPIKLIRCPQKLYLS